MPSVRFSLTQLKVFWSLTLTSIAWEGEGASGVCAGSSAAPPVILCAVLLEI